MDEAFVFGVIFTALFILVALIAKLALFCHKFAEDTQKICRKIDHADSDEEYRRRCELRCHYLCLIPFVNKKNVMRLYNRIFRKKDSTNTKEHKDSLVPLLLPSVLGVCLCAFCLCGMTWAWYSVSIETPAQRITSAYYWVKAEVEGEKMVKEEPVTGSAGEINNPETKSENISRYNLQANTSYTVILTAKGNGNQNRGGYCLIECGESKQYTQTINPGKTIKITLQTGAQDGVYTFTGVWGAIPSTVAENEIIKANAENAEDANVSTVCETTAEPDSTTVVPSDPIPSNLPVTEPIPDSATATDSFAVTEKPTDFDTAPSASNEHVSEEEKAIGGI